MSLFIMLTFDPPVIAHRGASGYAPENTMIAFVKAAQLGVRWVEFDVMESADGAAIIFHDETLDRTTNGRGLLDQYSYHYLHSLDAGSWFSTQFAGERIPTLKELIEFLQEANLSANLEIKPMPGKEERLVKRILKELADSKVNILFSSFSIPALKYLRSFAPESQIGLLLHEWEPNWEALCHDLNCVSVHVNEEIMTEESAKKIKAMDKALVCYTVNDVARAKALRKMGVDAVFSDVPDRILL
jgi:glycerophosphoryl diester phosphodiesterase